MFVGSLRQTDEIYVLEMFATVAAAVAVGKQPGDQGEVLSMDYNAEAGALIEASSRVSVVLALEGSFWRIAAQQSASCWAEGASSEANPADTPGRNMPLFTKPMFISCARSSGAPRNPQRVFGEI